MKFRTNQILLVLVILFLVFTVQSQKSGSQFVSSITVENEKIDTVIDTELVNINVSVRSSKKGYLKNLTFKNFEIYDDKSPQKVEFLNFDESTNQYNILYYPKIPATNKKQHVVKLKIKLSAEERKEFGKIIVNRQKWVLFKQEQK